MPPGSRPHQLIASPDFGKKAQFDHSHSANQTNVDFPRPHSSCCRTQRGCTHPGHPETCHVVSASAELNSYHLLHAARADLLRRAECRSEAAEAYGRAIGLFVNAAERGYLQRRLREVTC